MNKNAKSKKPIAMLEPTELHLQSFTEAYARAKGLDVVRLTIDSRNCLRIVNSQGNELENHDMTTHTGIYQFFALIETALNN